MDKYKKNLWLHNAFESFSKGVYSGTSLTKEHKIVLHKINDKYINKGVYVSEIIHTAAFDNLILSWNADTPVGTYIGIEAQVLINKHNNPLWSDWLSFGTWNSNGISSSAPKALSSNELAYIETDTIKVKGTLGETAGAVRYKLTLTTEIPDKTPCVKLIAGTYRNSKENPSEFNLSSDFEPELIYLKKKLDVPCFSQMLQDSKIASVICSPTSVAMILNYYGLKLTPVEVAEKVYDLEYKGYGNWPFNTAFAGSLGFEAYVLSCSSINDLKKEVYKGYPAAVSVKYKNSEKVEATLPIIHAAPISKTYGHLIVVCGFTEEDNEEYIIVNDPAAPSNEKVRVKYLLDEFEEAWQASGRIAYIIHP